MTGLIFKKVLLTPEFSRKPGQLAKIKLKKTSVVILGMPVT